MSQTITNAFIYQFNRNVYLLNQQMGSKIKGKVRVETVHAKKGFIDRLAPTSVQRKISRHQDTPLTEQIHSRRAVEIEDYVVADLVDREDQIRMLIDPSSLYAQNFAMGMGREMDAVFIRQLIADSDNGQFGGTAAVFPTGNTLASGGLGLTINRVREVKRTLDQKSVNSDGRIWVVSAQAMEDLLENTEVSSSDYNTVKALVQGSIEGNKWMGFEWVQIDGEASGSSILPIDSSLDRSTFAFQRDGVAFAMGQDQRTEMDRRPDKMNSLQVMVTASFGAVRVDDDAVLRVLVREV